MHLYQLTISSYHFWVGATANIPKSDDWKWSTDKGAFIIKQLLKKSNFRNHSYLVLSLLNRQCGILQEGYQVSKDDD